MRRSCFVALMILLGISSPSYSDALSKEKLIEMLAHGVDEDLIVGLVRKDCVDFEVDADAILELSDTVPKPILEAALECRQALDDLTTSESPPGVAAFAEDMDLSTHPAIPLSEIRRIAVIPLILDGRTDSALTGAFIQELKKGRPDFEIVDSLELQVHFEDTGAFHSNAPLKSLLAAARAVGVQAIIMGSGESYWAFDDPAVRLDIKIVETNRGKVAWTGGDRGKSQLRSKQAAKKNASKRVIRLIPEIAQGSRHSVSAPRSGTAPTHPRFPTPHPRSCMIMSHLTRGSQAPHAVFERRGDYGLEA